MATVMATRTRCVLSTRTTTPLTAAPAPTNTPDPKDPENASLDVPGICAEAFSRGARRCRGPT